MATSPSNLPFAFAMALAQDGTPLECCGKDSATWVPFDTKQTVRFDILASWYFRRARPRRSRVRDMADVETGESGTIADYRRRFGEEVIRAVCEYLRTSEAGHMVNHDLPGQVEREFLEPR